MEEIICMALLWVINALRHLRDRHLKAKHRGLLGNG